MIDYLKAMEQTLDIARDAIVRGLWTKNPMEKSSYDYLTEIERKARSGELPSLEFDYALAWMQCAVYINAPGLNTVDEFMRINRDATESPQPQGKSLARSS